MDTSTVFALRNITDPSALPSEPLLAATTLAHQLPVYACNPGDFDNIDGLQVVPVRPPEHASG